MENTKKGIKVWVFVLVVSILGGLVLLTLAGGWWLMRDRTSYRTQLENVYEKAYFDLVADLNDLEVKLSKVAVTSKSSFLEELLTDIWKQTDLAQSNLAQLSVKNSAVEETTTFVNQLGDYSYYLCEKLKNNEKLTESDYAAIQELHSVCMSVSSRLGELYDSVGIDFFFVDVDGKGTDNYSGIMDEIENTSIDYPELIYDGPFSDSVTNRTPEGLNGSEITPEQGLSIAQNLLKPLGYTVEYSYTAETKFKTYHYENEDNTASVTLAYTGELLNMNVVTSRDEAEFSQDQCVEIARGFLTNAGFLDLEEVWASNYYNTYYINFVTKSDDVIIYNDMVKVKVSAATGKVVGFDGLAYAYNHTADRIVPDSVITEEEALASVAGKLSNVSSRLALIPKNSDEILTYEIYGELNAYKYFVYVDARTGDTVNVLRVIDSEQGALLA